MSSLTRKEIIRSRLPMNDNLPPGVTDADLRKDAHVCDVDAETRRAEEREDREWEAWSLRQLWRDEE